MNQIKSEDAGTYDVSITAAEDKIIEEALRILNDRFYVRRDVSFTSPETVMNYMKLYIGAAEREQFVVAYLDTRHNMIGIETLFYGTINGASVYPREVVKSALKHNAAAVIFAHNHPSGIAEPSQADIAITARLKAALEVVDIRVLDHVIIGAECESMASAGLL